MIKVLIIDNEAATTDALRRLCDALDIPVEIAQTRSSAIRCCSENPLEVIFLSPDIPLVDAKALAAEIDNLAAEKQTQRPPLVVLYTDERVLTRYGLNRLPRSTALKKPIGMKDIYAILAAIGLISDAPVSEREEIIEEIASVERFIEESEAWISKLKKHLSEA